MLSLILTSFIVITFSYLFKLIQDMEKKIEDYKYNIDEEVLEGNLKCLGKHELDDWACEIFNKLLKKNEDGISIYVDEIPKNKIKEQVDNILENEMEYIASKDDIQELKDEIENMKNEFATEDYVDNELDNYVSVSALEANYYDEMDIDAKIKDIMELIKNLKQNTADLWGTQDLQRVKLEDLQNMKKEFCTWNEIKEFATQDDIEEVKVDIFNLIKAVDDLQRKVAVKTQYTT